LKKKFFFFLTKKKKRGLWGGRFLVQIT